MIGRDLGGDLERLRDSLAALSWVREVFVFAETGSTNDVARHLAAQGAPEGTVILADRQWAGRGRLGRVWHSPPGAGLYVSALFRPAAGAALLGRWTIAAATAACEACREVCGAPVVIKWPNDLLWRGLKVGGSLVEGRILGARPVELVVGTGINVRQQAEDFPPDLRGRAASLAMACGRPPDRTALAAAYLRRLGELSAALGRGAWLEVARRWLALAPAAEGARVRIVGAPGDELGPTEGITRGIADTGALEIERDDGTRLRVHLGESVAPVEA